MWWWSRFLLVAVQVPGSPTDVTRVIIDDRVIYSAPKGLTLRWASREILRCAANLLKKNKFWKWYGPLAVLINTQGIMDWWLPAEKPSVQGVSDRTENIWNWQLRRPVRHHHQIISMIILFIIIIITFPNLWTPFSVASHLAHLNQTTVEAGHVFQTQTSEKYLVIFIIIPIPDNYILHSVARNLNIFCTACPSDSGLRELPKRYVFIKKVNQKM